MLRTTPAQAPATATTQPATTIIERADELPIAHQRAREFGAREAQSDCDVLLRTCDGSHARQHALFVLLTVAELRAMSLDPCVAHEYAARATIYHAAYNQACIEHAAHDSNGGK